MFYGGRILKRRMRRKARLYPHLYSLEGLPRIASVRAFDERYTAPHHGFRDAADYYHRASSLRVVARIRVPTLILAAADDPFVPVAGESENGFRKLCAKHADEGLVCSSAGQSPGLVAIAAKTAITALQGEVLPQYVSVPIPLVEHPDFKAGENYYPDLTDNFFTPNEFPPCGVNISGPAIMSQDETDVN